MSNSAKPRNPLTVGNVVSAGLRIYRARFRSYYRLGLKAYLWLLVPIYGWAKFSAIHGLISRLAFAEVNQQPETVREAEGEVMPRMWSFLGTGILTNLAMMAFFLQFMLFSSLIIISVVGIVFTALGYPGNGEKISSFLAIFLLFASPISMIWLASRLFLIETILAVENDLNVRKAIDRCWKLTKGSLGRIEWIILISFLLTIPVYFMAAISGPIIHLAFEGMGSLLSKIFSMPSTENASALPEVVTLGILALLIPFWQCIKAATYYDIRNRREGLDLKLKDRPR